MEEDGDNLSNLLGNRNGRKRKREDKSAASQRKNENERRRREQENIALEELAEKLWLNNPDLNNVSSVKPDKCAILEQTVNQLRRIKTEREGINQTKSSEDSGQGDAVIQQSQVSSSKPILDNDVVGPLLLEALNAFLFLVNRQGKVEFATEHITHFLGYSQDDIIGSSIYNIIHVGDHAQFSSSLLPVSLGGWIPWPTENTSNKSRTFNCRMLVKSAETGDSDNPHQNSQYENMQITAVLQQLYDKDGDSSSQDPNDPQSCLVCVARKINSSDKVPPSHEQFTTKQDLKGKILACDTSGVNPCEHPYPEFIGHNIQDFVHNYDLDQLSKHHGEVVKNGSNTSSMYRFKLHENRYVFVQTKSKLFKSPSKRDAEFIMSTHSIIRDCESDAELKGSASTSLMKSIFGQPAAKNRDLRKPQLPGSKTASQALMGLSNQQANLFGGMTGNHGNLLDNTMDPMPTSDFNELLEFLVPDSADIEQLNSVSGNIGGNYSAVIGLGGTNHNMGHQLQSGIPSSTQASWSNTSINNNNMGIQRMASNPASNNNNTLATMMGSLHQQQHQTPSNMLLRSNSHPGGAQITSHHAMAMKSPISPGFQHQRSPGFANQRSPGFTPSPGIPSQRSPAPQLGAAGNYVRPPTPNTPSSLMSPPAMNTSLPSPLQELQSMEAKAGGVGLPNSKLLDQYRHLHNTQKMARQGKEGRAKLRQLLMQEKDTTQTGVIPNHFNKSVMGPFLPLTSPTSSTVGGGGIVGSTSSFTTNSSTQQLVRSTSSSSSSGQQQQHFRNSSVSSNKSISSDPRTPNNPLESPHSRPGPSPALSSPQQPQSTTPDSSSKDNTASGGTSGGKMLDGIGKDNILKQLLSADDEEDMLGDSQQQPATSTSNMDGGEKNENEAEPKKSDNTLLIKLLNESRHIDAEAHKGGKNRNELIQRLLQLEDEEDDQKTPKAESTSNEDSDSQQPKSLSQMGMRLPTSLISSSTVASNAQLASLGNMIKAGHNNNSNRGTPNPPSTNELSFQQQTNDILRQITGDMSLPGSPDKLDPTSQSDDQLQSYLTKLWEKQTDDSANDLGSLLGGGNLTLSNNTNASKGQVTKFNKITQKRKFSEQDTADSTESGMDPNPSMSIVSSLLGGISSGGGGSSGATAVSTAASATTPSQKNILLAQLLSQTPVSEGLLTQKQSVDVCSTPQAKLPKKELFDKIKQQHILQQQQQQQQHNNNNMPRKGPGRPPGSTNNKNKENLQNNVINKNLTSEKPNSWDNPRTNPNSPFPGNTKDNKDSQHMDSSNKVANVVHSTSNAGFSSATSSVGSPLSSSDALFSQLLKQADELHEDFNFDTTSTQGQGQNLGGQQLILDQPMTDDSNLYSQLEQVLNQTDFSPVELDNLLGISSNSNTQRAFQSVPGSNPIDNLSEQLQIDLIQQQLMSEVGSTKLSGTGSNVLGGGRSNEMHGGGLGQTAIPSQQSGIPYSTSQLSSMASQLPPNIGVVTSGQMKAPQQPPPPLPQQQQHQPSPQQSGNGLVPQSQQPGGPAGASSGQPGPHGFAQISQELRQLQQQQRNVLATLPNQGSRFPSPQAMKPNQGGNHQTMAQQVRHTILLQQQQKQRMRAAQQQRLLHHQRSFGAPNFGGQQNRVPQMPNTSVLDNFNEMMNTSMAPNVSLQRNQAPPGPMSPRFQQVNLNSMARGGSGGVPPKQSRMSPFGPGGNPNGPSGPQVPSPQWSQRSNPAMMTGGSVAQNQQQYGGMGPRQRIGSNGPLQQGGQLGNQDGPPPPPPQFNEPQYGPGGPSPQPGNQMMMTSPQPGNQMMSTQQQQQLRLFQARQIALQGLHSPVAGQGGQQGPFPSGGHQQVPDALMSPHQKLSPNNQISPQQQLNPGYSPSAGSLSSGSGGGGLSPNFPHPPSQNHLQGPGNMTPGGQGGNFNPMTSMGGYRPHTQQDLYNTSQGSSHQKNAISSSTAGSGISSTSQFVKQQLHELINTRSQQQQQQQQQNPGGMGGVLGGGGGNIPPPHSHPSHNIRLSQQGLGGDLNMDFGNPNGELPMDVLTALNELNQSAGLDAPPTSADMIFKEEKTMNKVGEEAKQRFKMFHHMAYQNQDQHQGITVSAAGGTGSGDLASNLFRNQLLSSSPSTPASDSSLPDLITGRKPDTPNVIQTEPRPPMEEIRQPEQKNSLLQALLSENT